MYRIQASIFSYLLISFISFSLFSQNVYDTYEKTMIKKNGIKKKTQWVYGSSATSGYKSMEVTYNSNGDILEETTYRSSGKVALKRNYKYDVKGNVIEYQSYDGLRDKITYKKFTKYDHNGNKILEAGFDGVDRFDNKYSYDSKGRVQEIGYFLSDNLSERRQIIYSGLKQEYTVYKGNNTISEKYVKIVDVNNNLTKEISYSSTGEEKKKIVYAYDSKNNLLSESKYFSGKSTETKTFVYVNGRLSKVYVQKPGESKYLDREYQYDATGKLILEKWIDTYSGKYSTKSFKYDNKGNAIEIKSFYAAYNFKEDVKITYNY